MKKILCLLSATLFALSSCSKDDKKSESGTGTSGLLKTVKYTDENYTRTTTFSYDGNKIKNFTDDDGRKRVFTYTGNTIKRVEDGGLEWNTTTLTYYNDKLMSYSVRLGQGQGMDEITDYTYNSDGTILALRKSSLSEVKDVCTLDTKGNIIKVEHSSDWLLSPSGKIIEYEYDTKNNPYRGISGYILLQTAYYAYHIFNQDVYSINNLTKITELTENGRRITTFENTYDTNNFLTKTVINDGNKDRRTYEYTYY